MWVGGRADRVFRMSMCMCACVLMWICLSHSLSLSIRRLARRTCVPGPSPKGAKLLRRCVGRKALRRRTAVAGLCVVIVVKAWSVPSVRPPCVCAGRKSGRVRSSRAERLIEHRVLGRFCRCVCCDLCVCTTSRTNLQHPSRPPFCVPRMSIVCVSPSDVLSLLVVDAHHE